MPITPTAEFANMAFPAWPSWLPLGRRSYNRLSHWLFRGLTRLIFGGVVKRIIDHLPPAPPHRPQERPRPVLYGYSPTVLPRPVDWDSSVHVCGYWFLDAPTTWQPPADLVAFLDAGPAPVYVGFGSMAGRAPEQTLQLVVDALAKAHLRGVVAAGWSAIDRSRLPDFVYAADSLPHDWLFPRVAAVAHHGGAGTTAAGLRAGVPSVVIPHMADQPFWARRVHALGAGPQPIARRRLDVDNLAAALNQAATDVEMRRRSQAIGERIRSERGADDAAATAIAYFQRALA